MFTLIVNAWGITSRKNRMPTQPNFFDRKIIFLLILLLGTLIGRPADFRPFDTATPSYIEFELDSYEVFEDATNLVLTVFRMGDFRTQASVDFMVEEGTATPGKDFKAVGGTIVFPGGQSFKTITIPVTWDEEEESDETFLVQLSNPSPNAEIVQTEAPVTIKDSAKMPRIGIERRNGTILLNWQPNGKNLVLQRSESSAASVWQDVTTEPVQVDGRQVVEEPVTSTFYFYRLRAKAE
ncbi:MAG: Calx-beta domain-containing protein [Verrucomicrobiales bacterium]